MTKKKTKSKAMVCFPVMISMNLKTHTNTTRKHLSIEKKMGVVILQLVVRYSILKLCLWNMITNFGICLGNSFLVGCNFKSRDYFQHFFQLKVVISQRKKEKCFQITTTTKEIVHFHEKNTFGEAASFYCICIPW